MSETKRRNDLGFSLKAKNLFYLNSKEIVLSKLTISLYKYLITPFFFVRVAIKFYFKIIEFIIRLHILGIYGKI